MRFLGAAVPLAIILIALGMLGYAAGNIVVPAAERTAYSTQTEILTQTVEGKPMTITQTETLVKRKTKIKWRTRYRTVTVERVAAIGGGGGGGGGGSASCHPSYRGECLDPTASDYDCAAGSGDGPRYVNGVVEVVGPDAFDLDRDGNGFGCE